jgi:SAM-dependent methyltransferase
LDTNPADRSDPIGDKALLRMLGPLERQGALDVLDLGAGNGWLSYRLAQRGHRCIAVDLRKDGVDGLGAAEELRQLAGFECVVAPFERLPLADRSADVAIFNASLHYATDLALVLSEAHRCIRAGGHIVIMDSPFYRPGADGDAMVREKGYTQGIKFLTLERLEQASKLQWNRRHVPYPLWYEWRPIRAWLRGHRPPSRFDLWWARVS